MSSGGIAHEKRREKRDLITVPMSYCLAAASGAQPQKERAASGITLNISGEGICFYTQICLEEGVAVNISSRALRERPRHGTVRWCRKITEELYRVGVSFKD
ncbi:MAG: PilZ domain-containing protein [Desulfobacteraceae bacterium]|nr:PilZ domain-containing protein [Desulfobacteraceae bacterium]